MERNQFKMFIVYNWLWVKVWRYFSNGILTSFVIKRENSYWENNYNLKEHLDEIRQDIDQKIDISAYEITVVEDDFIEFVMKPSFFEDNIYDLLKEMDSLTQPYFFKHIHYDKNNFKIACGFDEESLFVVKFNDKEIKEERLYFSLCWLINSKTLYRNIEVFGFVITLWMDINKYIGEDETALLNIINTFKNRYYKTKLGACLIYYIFG